jgi:hypothetical protein
MTVRRSSQAFFDSIDPEQTFSAVQEATAARLTCWYFCPQLIGAALLVGSSLVG